MKSGWGSIAQIDENAVVFRSVPLGNHVPRVTIGVPTYQRVETLKRTLDSIAKQTYRDFIVILSDNAGRNPSTLKAVRAFAEQLPSVILVAQDENIGATRNLQYLLAVAPSEFFMWLADDDEISPTYLEELVALLDTDHQAVAAMGKWQSMQSPSEGYVRNQSHHGEVNLLVRATKYVAGPTDDTLFYGVHRTDCLRRCSFDDYFYPNQGVLTNFCYVFLFDQILQGPIRYGENARWICHNYSEKQYQAATAQGVGDRLKTLARRINVYGLYCSKAWRKSPWLLLPVLAASLYGLLRDVCSAAVRISLRQLR